MTTYRIEAVANLDAASDAEAQGKLDAIAAILSDGDGELGYDWQLELEKECDAWKRVEDG